MCSARLLRLIGFAVVLSLSTMAAPPVMADACSSLGSCEWCDSGTRCYMPGGNPSACDDFDEGPAPCDWAGGYCSSTSGDLGVICECEPCEGEG